MFKYMRLCVFFMKFFFLSNSFAKHVYETIPTCSIFVYESPRLLISFICHSVSGRHMQILTYKLLFSGFFMPQVLAFTLNLNS